MSAWRVRSMLQELLSDFVRVLDQARIPWMVIGGQAVLVHGEPRLTRDVDITVGLGLDRLEELLEIVATIGWKPLVDPDEFTRRTMVLPCGVTGSPLRVDLILADSPYETEALRRAQEAGDARTDGIRFATPEDVVIHKLIAGRTRDLEDARSILLKQPELDRDWVRRWLKSYEDLLGEPLMDRLQELLRTL